MMFKKFALVSFIKSTVMASDEREFIKEIRDSVFPKLDSMQAMFAEFGQQESVEHEDDMEEAATGAGELGKATSEQYEVFKQTLAKTSSLFADVLYNAWSGVYDEELMMLAGQEQNGPAQPWGQYLQTDTNEPSGLQEAWKAYVDDATAKPQAIGDTSVVVGDDFDHESAEDRDKLKKTLCELRRKKVTLTTMAAAATGAQQWSVTNMDDSFAKAKHGRMWKGGKDDVRAFLLSADLFPKHADKFNRETPGGIITSVADEFVRAMKWLHDKRGSSDVYIIANGRSRTVEGKIVGTEEIYNHKDSAELFVVYSSADPKHDVRCPKKKVSSKGLNHETLHLLAPPRTRKTLKPRQEYNKCNEASSFDTTFTGVPHRYLTQIPRVDANGLMAILGQGAAAGAASMKDRYVEEQKKEKGTPSFGRSTSPSACSSSFSGASTSPMFWT
jgi:hypothetical protein